MKMCLFRNRLVWILKTEQPFPPVFLFLEWYKKVLFCSRHANDAKTSIKVMKGTHLVKSSLDK